MSPEVILLFIINLCSAMGYSLIAPLFPVLGNTRHIGDDLIGWIISVFALFNFAVTPFCPYLVNKLGRKNLFYFATILEATCTFLYGFLNLIDNYSLLIFLSFLGRVLHGVGSGITATLIYSLTSTISTPEEVQKSLGYMEIAWSLGVAAGPLLASVLYYLGGYPLPFFVLGICLYVAVICIHFLSLPLTNTEEESPSFMKALANFDVICIGIPVIIYLIGNTYYFPSLTTHLTKTWGLSIEVSSLFFVINMLVYFIILQFLDNITGLLGYTVTIWVGLVLIVIGPLFVYPLSFLPQYVFSIVIGLGLLGASGAMINVPCILEFARIIKTQDSSLDESIVNDMASAIYNFALNIGDFFGPILGGMISENYGFKYSNISISVMSLVYSIIYGLIYRKVFIKQWNNRSNPNNLLIDQGDNYIPVPTGNRSNSRIRFDLLAHRRHTSRSSYNSVHRIESPRHLSTDYN